MATEHPRGVKVSIPNEVCIRIELPKNAADVAPKWNVAFANAECVFDVNTGERILDRPMPIRDANESEIVMWKGLINAETIRSKRNENEAKNEKAAAETERDELATRVDELSVEIEELKQKLAAVTLERDSYLASGAQMRDLLTKHGIELTDATSEAEPTEHIG